MQIDLNKKKFEDIRNNELKSINDQRDILNKKEINLKDQHVS